MGDAPNTSRGRGSGSRNSYRFISNRQGRTAKSSGVQAVQIQNGVKQPTTGYRFWRAGPFFRGGGRKNSNARGRNDSNSPSHRRSKSGQLSIPEQMESKFSKTHSGFKLYFRNLPTIPNWNEKLDVVIEFLKRNQFATTSILKEVEEQEYYNIQYETIIQDAEFEEKWSTFATELEETPSDVLSIWGLAMHNLVERYVSARNADESEIPQSSLEIPFIAVRLMKSDPLTPLKSIKSSLLGKFVTIRGALVRTGTVRPLCLAMTFECTECCEQFAIEQPDGRFLYPKCCGASVECQGKIFQQIPDAQETTKFIDSRKVRVQDIKHNDSSERGSVPRTMDCNLSGNLVKLCNAGDVVTICGIVKMNKEPSAGGVDPSLHNLYIEVISLRNHKDSERTMGGNWFSFTNKDYYAVKEIHDTENLFRLLVASLCPSIYGHDLVKAGLLLCLFGGTPHDFSSNPVVLRRSDINVLMVGDPGLGKSQILNIVSEIAPRGVYVCGTSTSSAGLTVTLVKEGDEYSLEAGALVMADRGVCCIDEFDKMQSQHSALLEAMEQQSISIAKSGVFRTLPARTSVIAAANPVGGHYDKSKTVGENIKISPALLSRFDLIFILLDRPDVETDRNIVRHVMGIKMKGSPTKASQLSQCRDIGLLASEAKANKMKELLTERLKFRPDEEADLIPHHLLRKFIAYAKQYVKTELSPEAAAIIKQYYLNLRTKHRDIDSTPVTTRQLESLLRLTQARAKVELREIATAEDAKDVLEIFEFGLSGVFDSEIVTGLSQVTPMINMSVVSSRTQTKNQAKKLVSTLQRYAEEQKRNLLMMDEIKQIARALGLASGIDNLISKLNNEGFLLNKGSGKYQLLSVDF